VYENENDFSVSITATIKNSGQVDGDEVVQLYIRDDFSSIVTPVKQLRAFQRVHIPSGEQKTVSFELSTEDLMLLNPSMNWVVEPGTFTVMVGASSDDIRLQSQVEIKKEYRLVTSE
jgi:beta-glucosidase